jgi:hypothetical protein
MSDDIAAAVNVEGLMDSVLSASQSDERGTDHLRPSAAPHLPPRVRLGPGVVAVQRPAPLCRHVSSALSDE